MVPPSSNRISRVPLYSRTYFLFTHTGLSPTMATFSNVFWFLKISHWPGSLSLAATYEVSVDVLSSGYLDVSVRRVRLFNLCIQLKIPPKGWVAPFRNPRIKGYSHLPAAYRSVSRLSSPLSTKASTKRPSIA